MDAKVVITCKLLEGRVEFGDEGWTPSKTGEEVTEQSVSGWARGAGRGPGGGRGQRVGSGCQATSDTRSGCGRGVGALLEECGKGLSAQVLGGRQRRKSAMRDLAGKGEGRREARAGLQVGSNSGQLSWRV